MKKILDLSVLILCFVLPFVTIPLQAGELHYPILGIAKPLLKDAKAVVRNSNTQVRVTSSGKFLQESVLAVSILNKNGQDLASLTLAYNKSIKITSMSAKIYNASGVEIKYKEGLKVVDFSYPDYGTLYSDVRYKIIKPDYLEYPYTIVFEYSISMTNAVNYPNWYPIPDYNVSVENSSFGITMPPESKFRFFERNISSPPEKTEIEANTIYKWKLSNQEAWIDEPVNPDMNELFPSVLLTPNAIDYDDYKGSFDSWANFGAWIAKLNSGKEILPPETQDKIIKLTSGMADKRQKTKAVYEYMQNKTRYVSVQIGIGGFQPIDAEIVDRLGYGDCKALANYTKALLKAAGIPSYYTIVGAGSNNPKVITEFPSNQFNHAILCVPMDYDTVWLECTSQHAPFNFLGDFTSDRQVLVIDDNKGTLVRTPDFSNGKTFVSRNISFDPDAEGYGLAIATTIYSGYQYDDYSSMLRLDQMEQKKRIIKKIHIPNFVLSEYKLSESRNEPPTITEHLEIQVSEYITAIGSKLICNLNMMNQWDASPFVAISRKYDIQVKWPVNEVDTVNITIPTGYKVDKLPASISMDTEFGTYSAKVVAIENKLQYIRQFSVYQGQYKTEKYTEIVNFFDKVVTSDAMKAVFVKSN